MLNVTPGGGFEAVAETGVSGLVNTISIRVDDNTDTTVSGPSAANIIEIGTTGVYVGSRAAPLPEGQYTILWSTDGTFDPDTVIIEDLIVSADTAFSPVLPSGLDSSSHGPCTAWVEIEDVVDCCSADVGSDDSVLIPYVAAASEILYELSGGRFSSWCGRTVRPCSDQGGCVVVDRYVDPILWDGLAWRTGVAHGAACGCCSVPKIRLPGYPVREIVEVLIDGVALDPAEYELQSGRDLVRLAVDGDRVEWPGCQRLDYPSTEVGTFEVTYLWGADPPTSGRMAAASLACELYRACAGIGDCSLPSGTTSVTRQGVSIQRSLVADYLRTGRSGIPSIDLFVTVYGRKVKGRTAAWSPDIDQYARRGA